MIIPIGTESDGVRRLPWITFAIIGICLVVHIMVNSKASDIQEDLAGLAQQYMQYFMAHPYLEPSVEMKGIFFNYPGAEEELEGFRAMQGKDAPYGYTLDEEQAELDGIGEQFIQKLNEHPLRKWGYTPAHKSLKTQFTSMFLHADWLHLIFNMLFLYISAPFIEDVWGRWIFLVFYVLMGLMSAFAHTMHYPASTVPLVGASGAIAGVMGAFLIRFWNVRIRFVYFFSLFLRGTFSAPAWLMLPLWVIEEVIKAKWADSVTAYGGGGGGVAHWVHVWGFVLGMIVALAIKFLKVEEKYIAPKILEEISYTNESLSTVEKARDIMASGNKEEAYNMLLEAAKKDPRNGDILDPLWTLALTLEKKEEVAPFLQRQVDVLVRQNQPESAFLYFKELRMHVPDSHFSIMTSTIMLQQMVKQNLYKEAEVFALEVGSEVSLGVAPGVLLDFCNVLSSIDLELTRTHAQQYLQMALKHPDIADSTKEELKKRLFEGPVAVGGVNEGLGAGMVSALALNGTRPKPGPASTPPPPPPVPDHTGSGTMFSLEQFSEEPVPPPPFPTQLHATGKPASRDIEGSGPLFTLEQFSAEPPPPPPFPIDLSSIKTSHLPEEQPTQLLTPPPIPGSMPGHKTGQPPSIAEEQVTQLLSPPPIPGQTPGKKTGPRPFVPEDPVTQFMSPPPIPDFAKPQEPAPATTELITLDFSTISAPPPPPRFVQQKIIKPTFASPLEIKDGRIALDVDGVGQRALPFQKIKAMAVAKITPTGQNMFLLVDLFLDEPNTLAASNPETPVIDVRSLRITSNRFNHTKLIPKAQTLGEAFRAFVTGLQKLSGAVPYPHLENVILKKVLTYPSIEVYEDGIFNSTPTPS